MFFNHPCFCQRPIFMPLYVHVVQDGF
jgi:hypothetical protein